jgi:hypothetical protein
MVSFSPAGFLVFIRRDHTPAFSVLLVSSDGRATEFAFGILRHNGSAVQLGVRAKAAENRPEPGLVFCRPAARVSRMSTVQEIQAALKQLSVEEMQQVRDLIEDMIEDQLELTDEFKAKIAASEREMAEGKRPRVG